MLSYEVKRTPDTLCYGLHGQIHRLNRPAYVYQNNDYQIFSFFNHGKLLHTIKLDGTNNTYNIEINCEIRINSNVLTELCKRMDKHDISLMINPEMAKGL